MSADGTNLPHRLSAGVASFEGTLPRSRQSGGAALDQSRESLALQLPFMEFSESMGNHDSKIVDAASVD
jgi:hypothetical protein